MGKYNDQSDDKYKGLFVNRTKNTSKISNSGWAEFLLEKKREMKPRNNQSGIDKMLTNQKTNKSESDKTYMAATAGLLGFVGAYAILKHYFNVDFSSDDIKSAIDSCGGINQYMNKVFWPREGAEILGALTIGAGTFAGIRKYLGKKGKPGGIY